jgi:integral membrane protein
MNVLRQLRLVAFLEGLSFVILLFIAVPLKHFAGMPLAVRIAGMTHGILFLLFIVALFRAATAHDWPARRWALAFVSSLLPFGTFVFDRSLKAEAELAQRPVGGIETARP